MTTRMPGGRTAVSESEVTLSRYIEDYTDSGKSLGYFIVRHFGRSVSAFIALSRTPHYKIVLSARPQGAAIRDIMMRHSVLARMTGLATAVLILPREAGQYSAGTSKRTLRSKAQKANQLGLSWARIDDPDERVNLLKLANERERTHPDAAYRVTDPDNSDLLEYPLWLTAFSADGSPLLLCVVIVDNQVALLRYFRTLGSGREYSISRYFMTQVMAEYLVARRIRYVFDDTSPFRLNKGLRLFQRMIGFRIARVYIARRTVNICCRPELL